MCCKNSEIINPNTTGIKRLSTEGDNIGSFWDQRKKEEFSSEDMSPAVVVYGGSFPPETVQAWPTGTITYSPTCTCGKESSEDVCPEPFVCPVCDGRGNVRKGFYEWKTEESETQFVPCRTCNGKGIIWSEK